MAEVPQPGSGEARGRDLARLRKQLVAAVERIAKLEIAIAGIAFDHAAAGRLTPAQRAILFPLYQAQQPADLADWITSMLHQMQR